MNAAMNASILIANVFDARVGQSGKNAQSGIRKQIQRRLKNFYSELKN